MNNITVIARKSVVFSIVRPEVGRGVQLNMLSDVVRERPSVCRLELLVPANAHHAVEVLTSKLKQLRETIEIHQTDARLDESDYEGVYTELYQWLDSFDFDIAEEDYLIDMSGGPAIVRAFLLNMAKDWVFPIKPIFRSARGAVPSHEIVDIGVLHHSAMMVATESRVIDGCAALASTSSTVSGSSPLTGRIYKVARHSADPILLMGPSGVGKTELAKGIFDLKVLAWQITGKLVSVNCATIQGDTAISMLFGHKKGAFTGATVNHPGYLMDADNGLLFLDEIGELSPGAQAMLLKAIEEKTFRPLGATEDKSSDFQLIAGTNRDLFKEVDEGNFRADLLARISVWSFELPAITEVRDRIPKAVDDALKKFKGNKGHGATFETNAKASYLEFAKSNEATWPGNYRDLNASVHRMATLANNGTIQSEQVEEEVAELRRRWGVHKKKRGATPRSYFATENMPDRYLGILEQAFPDDVKNWGFLEQIQMAYLLEACAKCENGADAYRCLYNTEGGAGDNISQKMKRFLDKFRPGLKFEEIKSRLGEVGRN